MPALLRHASLTPALQKYFFTSTSTGTATYIAGCWGEREQRVSPRLKWGEGSKVVRMTRKGTLWQVAVPDVQVQQDLFALTSVNLDSKDAQWL